MITTAKILKYDGEHLLLVPDEKLDREIVQKHIGSVEIRLNDGRTISAIQRKKIFALIRDISLWSGHEPEYIRQYFTWDFCQKYGCGWFSLSDADMTTAKDFITYDTEHDTTTLRRSVRALFRAAAFAFYPSRHHSRHSSKIFWDFT